MLFIPHIKLVLFEMQLTAILSKLVKLPGFHASIRKYSMILGSLDQQLSQLRQQWKQKYVPLLSQNKVISQELWENMRKYMIELNDNPATADSIILEVLKDENYSDAGISYYKFLKSNNYDIPITTLCRYMELYTSKESPLSTIEKDYICNVCNSIINKYATYDRYTAVVLVNSFCKIDKWEEAVKVIENYETYDNDCPVHAYNTLIAYFFTHGYEKLGYKYLSDVFTRGKTLSIGFYNSYFEYCLKEKDTFNEKIEKLFKLWYRYGFKPTEQIMSACIKVCNQAGWSATFGLISNETCNICKQKLSDVDITDEEFEKLREAIKKELILGKMYEVTNPNEMKRFVEFINRRKPYDIVVDGLNILCVNYGSTELKNQLTHFKAQNKKVLVIGRQHLKKFLEKAQLFRLADYFLVENMSKDDPFLLYAAFSSRKDTKIISNDLMRNHEFCIKDAELKAVFKKWQILHQYSRFSKNNRVIKLNSTQAIDAVVQKQDNCWHIPYMKTSGTMSRRHTCDSHWTCLNMCP